MKIVTFEVGKEEFKHYVGREPKKGELEDFAHFIQNGIDAQLDWEVLYSCAGDEIKRNEEEVEE